MAHYCHPSQSFWADLEIVKNLLLLSEIELIEDIEDCLKLLKETLEIADSRAFPREESNIAMIAITTSNSTRVNFFQRGTQTYIKQ